MFGGAFCKHVPPLQGISSKELGRGSGMKNGRAASVMACVGAVIGAGFASGREIVTFFTRYGAHAWWLMALAAGMMAMLCALITESARRFGGGHGWCGLFPGRAWVAQGCALVLMTVTGGAMVSAAGQMISLLWPSHWAYSVGVVGTLLAAWWLGNLRVLGWISGALTAMLTAMILLAMAGTASRPVVMLGSPRTAVALIGAAVRAAAYAAMNMTLAIGVVCQSARSRAQNRRLSAVFGGGMALLLCMSNLLYLRHPEQLDAAFPIVELLRGFGRRGFVISVVLLYLSILTTLAAVLYALRDAAQSHVESPALQAIAAMGPPLAVSCVGFSGIVETLYAPIGIVCLFAVFLPLALRIFRDRKERLDKSPVHTVR